MKHPITRLLTTTCLTTALVLVAGPVVANPTDGTVVAGSAGISSTGNVLTVQQHSDKAVIDWRGFDIGAGETTQFVQPNSNSIALNRVTQGGASRIDGALTANGNVVIINQNGVVFGAGSRVDVNGLVVSTADIDNDQFMNGNGRLVFDKAGTGQPPFVGPEIKLQYGVFGGMKEGAGA